MMLDSAPKGMVMVFREAITPGEVEDHLKDTLDHLKCPMANLVIVYPVSSHSPMCPDAGFIELVSCVAVSSPANPSLDLIMVVCSPVFTFGSLIHHHQRTLREGEELGRG
jgi:hypothetical protein